MQIAIGLFPGFTSLDGVGPYQVFSYLPGADVVVCAARSGFLADEHGLLHFDVAATFDDVPAPDVLVIPGGQITHRMVRDGDPIIEWIRAVHSQTTYTTSVCTGALLLGAHRGRRFRRHRSGAHARRAHGRPGDNASHPARHRIRPAATVRRRCSVEGTSRYP